MQAIQTARQRNQAIEWGRLLASCLVVFIHVPLPGKVGMYIACLARMAVPYFFLVSGYFCYGTDSKRLLRRLVYVGKLCLLATLLYILWGYGRFWYYGGGTVADYFRVILSEGEPLRDFLVFQVNPFAGHLWYLLALLLCQGVLLIYTLCFLRRGMGLRLLYGVGAILLSAFFYFSMIRFEGLPNYFYRNGWLMGLPLFLLGLFLGEHAGKVPLGDGGLLGIAVAGMGLSLFQYMRFGVIELPVGSLIAVVALVLFLAGHPELGSGRMGKLAGKLGTVSTVVYVVHLALLDAYEMFLKEPLAARLGSREAWLRPFAVLACALAVAMGYERIEYFWKRKKQKSIS